MIKRTDGRHSMREMAAQPWIEKIGEAARQDPRKTGALGVLLLVLSVMGGRMLVTGDSQPARASGRAARAVPTSAKARRGVGATGVTGSIQSGSAVGNNSRAL